MIDKNWDVLVSVAKADEFSRGSTFKHAGEFEKIVDKAIKIKEKFGQKEVNKRLKIVDGNRIQKLLNISPGPKVGKIIKKVTEYVLDNDVNVDNQEEIDNLVKKYADI